MSDQPTSGAKVLIDGEWCVELSAEFLCAMCGLERPPEPLTLNEQKRNVDRNIHQPRRKK